MLTLFQKFSQPLFDLLYPPVCLNCKSSDSWLCPDCLAKIEYIHPPICERCGTAKPDGDRHCEQCRNNPLLSIDGIRAAAYFENESLRPAIHFLKYKNHKVVAAILAEILADACRRFDLSGDVIVPVPLHITRYRERGYNQSELLARQLGRLLNRPVDTTTLARVRKTRSQMELGAGERHQNVADAFACINDSLAGQVVLLIDDVCTTGSTLDACAKALKQTGGAFVWGVTLAKAR
jgi:ComF family protein